MQENLKNNYLNKFLNGEVSMYVYKSSKEKALAYLESVELKHDILFLGKGSICPGQGIKGQDYFTVKKRSDKEYIIKVHRISEDIPVPLDWREIRAGEEMDSLDVPYPFNQVLHGSKVTRLVDGTIVSVWVASKNIVEELSEEFLEEDCKWTLLEIVQEGEHAGEHQLDNVTYLNDEALMSLRMDPFYLPTPEGYIFTEKLTEEGDSTFTLEQYEKGRADQEFKYTYLKNMNRSIDFAQVSIVNNNTVTVNIS